MRNQSHLKAPSALVTGASGYIGSRLVPLLLRLGHEVFAVDTRPVAATPATKSLLCHTLTEDFRSLVVMKDVLPHVTTVYHLAWKHQDYEASPTDCLRQNRDGLQTLVHAAAEQSVERFVLLSSCSVYGNCHGRLVDENSPVNPAGLYAEQKVLCEEVVKSTGGTDMQNIIVRPATVNGLSWCMRWNLTVNQLVQSALRKREVVLPAEDYIRSHIHIRDLCKALIALAIPLQPFSLAKHPTLLLSTQTSTYKQLLAIIAELTPVDSVKREQQHVERSYSVSDECFKAIVGATTSVSLEQSMASIVQGLRNGRKYYEA